MLIVARIYELEYVEGLRYRCCTKFTIHRDISNSQGRAHVETKVFNWILIIFWQQNLCIYIYTYYIYTPNIVKHKITPFYSYLAQTSLFTSLFHFPTMWLGIATTWLGHEYIVYKSIITRKNQSIPILIYVCRYRFILMSDTYRVTVMDTVYSYSWKIYPIDTLLYSY
jgi:hypothetical protein